MPDYKQSTLADIIDSEGRMAFDAHERYGRYFQNALSLNNLVQQGIVNVDKNHFVFACFFSSVKKHITLALLSAVRLHHTQASMDLRQAIESGSAAAYAIGNPELEKFVDNSSEILEIPENLTTTQYRWLDEHYAEGSKALRQFKKHINHLSAHSNLIYAQKIFRYQEDLSSFYTPFFDIEDEYHVKSDLWFTAHVTLILLDLLYGVNQNYQSLIFVENFQSQLSTFQKESIALKNEMIEDARFKAVEEKLKLLEAQL